MEAGDQKFKVERERVVETHYFRRNEAENTLQHNTTEPCTLFNNFRRLELLWVLQRLKGPNWKISDLVYRMSSRPAGAA